MKKRIWIILSVLTFVILFIFARKKLKAKSNTFPKKENLKLENKVTINEKKYEKEHEINCIKQNISSNITSNTKKRFKPIKLLGFLFIISSIFIVSFTYQPKTTIISQEQTETQNITTQEQIMILEKQRQIKEANKRSLNNLKEINNLLDLINKKFEIIKTIIPEEYNQLEQLEKEILSLNLTIEKSKKEITSEQDINDDITTSLVDVNYALTQLIEAFGKEENNIFVVKIVSIGDNFIEVNYNEKIYKLITTNTLYDGLIIKDNSVLIICDKRISQKNVNCLIMIEK